MAEGRVLDARFQLYVKGSGSDDLAISGTITSAADGTAGKKIQ